ncbi:MAG: hypothetical protein IPM38_08325 [Ignavibacteria bacterium]|nr:hypothetical protein [Ignavibacteria bacterium]
MKRKLCLTALLLFLSLSFSSNPPGWYVQRLPVNDLVNDVFFLDSLNGWLVTQGDNDPVDTSYIMRTTNGGDNWTIQMRQAQNLNVVQFLDINTVTLPENARSGFTRIYKTTVGGLQWRLVPSTGMALINDMFLSIRIPGGFVT